MIFHLNHLFNPAKRSMHMYVTEYRKIKTCHWKTQCRHKYLTGYNQLNPERQNFFSPAKLGPLTETSMYIKPPRKYGLHAIVVRFSGKITERITLCTCMSAL